ncbi:FAD dependent oxidoreductase [Jaminaea rosea]|uniref:FAD dependent oxidoreductase n=1 Tax=Jaminaea rosea TaxID=1569628 RepID=A0A316UN42_9BASI|nr:FAD dependent oxidoreductase [Jaminaea rosea]PWN26707.1 FAD dependent oxidoreductase [Jaminaea rosea]
MSSSASASSSTTLPRDAPFLIVGGGVYGASTALALTRAGYTNVTVLERSADGHCASDAASNDLNKVVRADYSDLNFLSLAKEAISQWRQDPIFSPYFHENGCLYHSGVGADANSPRFHTHVERGVRLASRSEDAMLELARKDTPLPPVAYPIKEDKDVLTAFPPALKTKLGHGLTKFGVSQTGYFNPRGGWAEANTATRSALNEAQRLGAKLVGNALVTELILDGKKTKGVKTADGRTFMAENTIIAAGSWSRILLEKLLPNSSVSGKLAPASHSAQCVLMLKLTPEECAAFANGPIITNLGTGFYVFPPNPDGILKAAIHGDDGFANPAPSFEPQWSENGPFPSFKDGTEASFNGARQPTKHGKSNSVTYVPEDKAEQMMVQLLRLYPFLSNVDRSRISSRICWYSDTHDENWIIDEHPDVENLVVAGGDSGHGFKFLPNIGRLIASRVRGGVASMAPLTEHQKKVFSFKHHMELAERAARGEKIQTADSARSHGGDPAAANPNWSKGPAFTIPQARL